MFLPLSPLPVRFPDPRLKDLYEEARREKFPVVEPEVGALLYLLVRLLKPKKVFEFGSGFGYSALWMALACPPDCRIYCTDYQEKNRKRAEKLFKTFGVEGKITYLVGEAQTLFVQQGFEKESLDLVVFDHEKQNYSETLDLVLPKLKRGGMVVADDALLDLKLDPQSLKAKALRFFRREVLTRPDLYSVILPLGDGVALIQ
ncbi:MAG: O-methyltransferase, partial [Aquificae bacterium]|nr:O-methyltransferase [Aquificota bacterium]